ncbi:MAG: aminoacyl-tRNA hydrolase [Chloroflexi bacterium]|nr:aminoacyl-tRNA hydrolase [Chloroflexota bacterium]
MNNELVWITDQLGIPLSELEFRFSRSGGPGGQHVNRSATRVELLFDVAGSPSLSEEQRQRVLTRLAGRMDSEGILRVVAESERSQFRNRQEAVERFQALLRQALHVPKRRRRTKVPRWAKERRLATKQRRSEVKRYRGRVGAED